MPTSTWEIGGALCAALQLPRNTVEFTLRCRAGEMVTVECEYWPDNAMGAVTALAEYELVRRAGAAETESAHPAEAIGFDAWMRERTEAAHQAFMKATGPKPTPQRYARGGMLPAGHRLVGESGPELNL